jgi:hypothetical protein
MEAKKTTISASAAKLDKLLNGLPDIKSSKTFKQKQKYCLSHVQTVESCINSMIDPKEPEFKRTMNYIDLKSKASMLRIKEKQREKEKLDKIQELFTHSSKNSYEFIHPDMLKDQIVKKVLRKNKRSFGGFEERSNFRDIKPCIVNKNILTSKLAKKNLENILYNNTYRNSLKFNNNRIIKNLEVKTPISHATSPKYEERLVTIKGEKEVDLHLKELIQQSMLEFGELKMKLARCLIYKVKNI